jgi:hypothetical protein
VSAERELPWDQINPDDDETWSWADAARFYSDGEWTHEQRVGFDAYRLALGLIHYFNALPQQNRLDCAGWAKDSSANGKTCLKPVFYVHDLGSTFGKKRSALNLLGTNPRGVYSAYAQQTVFANAASCQLRDTLLGDKQVLREAQEIMIQRLAKLDRRHREEHPSSCAVRHDGPGTGETAPRERSSQLRRGRSRRVDRCLHAEDRGDPHGTELQGRLSLSFLL